MGGGEQGEDCAGRTPQALSPPPSRKPALPDFGLFGDPLGDHVVALQDRRTRSSGAAQALELGGRRDPKAARREPVCPVRPFLCGPARRSGKPVVGEVWEPMGSLPAHAGLARSKHLHGVCTRQGRHWGGGGVARERLPEEVASDARSLSTRQEALGRCRVGQRARDCSTLAARSPASRASLTWASLQSLWPLSCGTSGHAEKWAGPGVVQVRVSEQGRAADLDLLMGGRWP